MRTLDFIRAGLGREEPVVVLAHERRHGPLRAALGADTPRVTFDDLAAYGRNPARILPRWREHVDAQAASRRPLRAVSEALWPDYTADELAEYHEHESLLNTAFDGGPPWWLLCPYDCDALPAEAVHTARTTHPYLTENGSRVASDVFSSRDPLRVRLPAPPEDAKRLLFDISDLRRLRPLVREIAHSAGVGTDRAEDLVLAVTELATNTIRHGGGLGTLLTWKQGDRLIMQIDDMGHIDDPLAGRIRPYRPGTPEGNAGLWLVHHLCDLVQIQSTPAGTSIRVQMCGE